MLQIIRKKDICITSSQTIHKNPGDARFSKFSSSENRVSHDLNNRNQKKCHQHSTFYSQPSNPLTNQVEPCGMMWNPEGFNIPFRNLPGESNQKRPFVFVSGLFFQRAVSENNVEQLVIMPVMLTPHSASGQPKSWLQTWNPTRSWFGETRRQHHFQWLVSLVLQHLGHLWFILWIISFWPEWPSFD